jgi:hypothetical protein
MNPDDKKALTELLAAGEDYLMLLGRLWRGDIQAMPEAKRERLIETLIEVVRRSDR